MWFKAFLVTACSMCLSLYSISGLANEEESGSYLQIGLIGGLFDGIFEDDISYIADINVEGRYAWKGMFIEMDNDTIDVPGIALGYELWDNANWSVDLIAIPITPYIDPEDFDRFEQSNLEIRKIMVVAGTRITRFFDNIVIQGHLLPVGEGPAGSLAVGYIWQYKNWNFSMLTAARYNSETINSHVWSVSEEESSEEFAVYDAGAGTTLSTQFRAEYPITEHWVAEASVFYFYLEDAVADSPLTTQRSVTGLTLEINYVF